MVLTDQTASYLQRSRHWQRQAEDVRLDTVAEQRETRRHVVTQTLLGLDVAGGEEHLTAPRQYEDGFKSFLHNNCYSHCSVFYNVYFNT